MKNHIYTLIAFAVFAASALASPATEMEVKVPFAFKAAGTTLPAGDYRITASTGGLILIRGDKGGVFVPRNSVVVDTSDSGKTTFQFSRSGDKYVLQTVHTEK